MELKEKAMVRMRF